MTNQTIIIGLAMASLLLVGFGLNQASVGLVTLQQETLTRNPKLVPPIIDFKNPNLTLILLISLNYLFQ